MSPQKEATPIGGIEMKIVTSHDFPPIPDRSFDWSAVTDYYDLGHPIGHGATEAEAIEDLKQQIEENEA